jgi:hypothetical protein
MNLHLALAIILPFLQPLVLNQLTVVNKQPARWPPPDSYSLSTEKFSFSTVKNIPLPPGYERLPAADASFAAWLRNRPLKNNNTVYLYNGMPKRNQGAQFAVLDIPVGTQDLQQCADAVMRLRAEYLYDREQWNQIIFTDNNRKAYRYQNGKDRAAFERYLRNVFSWCGSASLEKQLKPAGRLSQIMPGDVLIKGGYPGHAVIVMDAAVNPRGERIYMLAQSYMPAQDIHILKNPADGRLSPWYKAIDNQTILTPEWTFEPHHLRRW